MANIRVAVLDTGISNEIVDERVKLNKQVYYDYYDNCIVISDSRGDYNGHGTLCINTMWNVTPDIDIYSINMLGISGISNSMVFLETLKYTITLDVDIIAICASCVVPNMQSELRKICRQIHDSGKIILAAVENGKETSSIADYDTVLGVIGANIEGIKFSFTESMDIQMCCDSKSVITDGTRKIKRGFMGNSRATALATGIVAKLILENNDLSKDIIQLLNENKSSDRENEDSIIQDLSTEIEFDEKIENHLIETEIGYHKFLYLLCEFFVCEDPGIVRTANLLEFCDMKLTYKVDNLICFIEERFNVQLNFIDLNDFRWAYLFYEKHLK